MHLDSALVNVDESFQGFGSWYLPRVHHWKLMLMLFIKKKIKLMLMLKEVMQIFYWIQRRLYQ